MKEISLFGLMVGFVIFGAGSESVLAQTTIAVPAIKFCVDSGINVSRGDSLQFSASGQGSYGYEGSPVNSTPLTNPDGDRFVNGVNIGKKDDPNAIYKGFIGGLVGKVGTNGNYFFIGSNNQLSMGQSGRLFLCYNDVANSFNNNTGGYRVSINRISDPNQQNTAGRPLQTNRLPQGDRPVVAQNVNQFNRFEIGKLSTGEKILRVPPEQMLQSPFKEAMRQPLRPISDEQKQFISREDSGIFLWNGRKLIFTGLGVATLADLKIGNQTYWVTLVTSTFGDGPLEISQPNFVNSKRVILSGAEPHRGSSSPTTPVNSLSELKIDSSKNGFFYGTVRYGNGWNYPVITYLLDLRIAAANPNQNVVVCESSRYTYLRSGVSPTKENPDCRTGQQVIARRSLSPSQQTPTAGRSPSSNQQNPQRQTQINGDDTIVYNNIVCSGKTRNFLGQESPASCRSKEADSRLIFNSITWERQADRSIKVEMKVFNQGSAEALVQIYNSKKQLVKIKIIEGNKPPTGLIDSGIDMFTRFPVSLFNQYSLTDARKNLNEQEFSDNNKNSLIIPPGGYLKITKSSNEAFRYNAAMLSLELVLLTQGDPGFAKDETVKQFVKRFAEEAYFSRTSKTTINFFKSEPSSQAMFTMDLVDPNKAAEVFKQLIEFSVSGESDPSKNPFIGAFLDVYKDVGNIGLEIALDKFILPGLGTFVKATRITGSKLNTFARGADLYYATAAGEKATITLEDADKLRN
ncbi:hypothetical protein [Microcoleus sp.]|uniref:hypothetical protein n=1 Tax=Microcoleus sp. TaxID=44472 RepID=UPI00352537AE